jgi:hypothetical protein
VNKAAVHFFEVEYTTEMRVKNVLDALRKADAQDPNRIGAAMKSMTDDYERVVRE